MTAKEKNSIRGKLTAIIMLTSTTAVLVACLGFVLQDVIDARQDLDEDLITGGELIGVNSNAALTFGDHQTAREALSALRTKPSFVAGCIYTGRDAPFATYFHGTATALPRLPRAIDGIVRGDGRVELFRPIMSDGERIGTLYIASDLRDLHARLKEDAQATAVILLVCLIVAFTLSSRLQRRISEPIVELARVAGEVSQNKDYAVRVTPPGLHVSAEVDNLMTGFNSMLAEIEQRDHRLLLHQTNLEQTVALRTDELTAANAELLVAKTFAEKVAEIYARLAGESALILNSATDGIMGIGLDNRPTFLNPAASRMLGMTLSDIAGISIHEAIHHSHADGTPWPEKECANTQTMHRGELIRTADDTFWRPDGTSFQVEYSSTPMFDEDGDHLGAVVMFRDVTERRAVERLKSEFVSTVSHELRTPLTSIRGALGLLSSGLLGPIAEKGRRMLEIAVSNTDRLVRLINDILDLERIESGRVELARGSVDANTVMVQALEGLQPMADQAGVHLVIVPARGQLWGDSDRIVQTLTNLLGNAIKFSPPDTTVTLSGAAGQTDFAFCVADHGRGVPEQKLETIFERFSQVDASDSRDKGGSGLGLAICQSIVSAHGGRIWAERNDPAGSRFQFTIPLTVPSMAATSEPLRTGETGQPVDLALDGPSILVVEDDLDLARVMTMALQSHGIRTFHAASGSEAVQVCRQQEPTLIVLDLSLPDMDGFAVVSSLRESATLGRIPLLVYSALDVGSVDQSRLRLGPTEFLTKSRCSLAEFEGHVIRLLGTVTDRTKEGQYAA
jgi:PAS domain S-box-containing protein